jgi:hypothetical protein
MATMSVTYSIKFSISCGSLYLDGNPLGPTTKTPLKFPSSPEPEYSPTTVVTPAAASLEASAFRMGYFGLVARLFAGLAGSLPFFTSFKRMIAAAAA